MVKPLKKYLGLIPVALFALILGCGGGGGGGGSNGGGGCRQVAYLSGNTGVQAGDTILGQVTDEGGCVMPNVTVRFFNAANQQQGSAVTNTDGYWRGPAPTTVTKVDVDGDLLPLTVYKGFAYGSAIFQASTTTPVNTDCKVPAPALNTNSVTHMPNGPFRFYLATSPPPPPPTGCVP